MNLFRRKYFLALGFVAAFVFFSFSLGGEFLHDRIHHHATQAQHDDCPVYQLLGQVFLLVVAVAFSAALVRVTCIGCPPANFFLHPPYTLPFLRAPPVSL